MPIERSFIPKKIDLLSSQLNLLEMRGGGIVPSMNDESSIVCKRCDEEIEDELVYCFKCGSPHHRNCFEEHRQCAKSACKVTVYVANDGSGTVECRDLPLREKSTESPSGSSMSTSELGKDEPTMLEMTAALLFAFVVFVLVCLLWQTL